MGASTGIRRGQPGTGTRGRDLRDGPNARWVSVARHRIRFVPLRWTSRCPLATTGGAATAKGALRSAGDARRNSMDWHFCRACELEWQQADRVPGGWPSLCDIAA